MDISNKKGALIGLMYTYTLIYTSKLPFIKHEILTLPSGLATHNHPDKQIIVECIKEAIGGGKIIGQRTIISDLSESQLIAGAEVIARRRRYELKYNCEDYIAELFGKPPMSKQRNFWFVFGVVGLGLMATR